MNNKVKLVLIAVELFILVVLLLVGVGCQQKWIIVTGDGPRFDWYALVETQPPTDKPDIPTESTAPPTEENIEPETTEPPATTRPQATTQPPTEPEDSTTSSEETTVPDETTGPEESTGSSGTREDELPRVPIN